MLYYSFLNRTCSAKRVFNAFFRPVFLFSFLLMAFLSPFFTGETSAGIYSCGERVPADPESGFFLKYFDLFCAPVSFLENSVNSIIEEDISSGTKNETFSEAESDIFLNDLTEIPKNFEPRIKSMSEQESDILKAEYLYTQGRLLETKGERSAALQKYERAFRYGGNSESILAQIISLAGELNRPGEVQVYFKKAVDLSKLDVLALRNAAVQLTRVEAWEDVIRAYETALESPVVYGNPAVALFFRLELGRCYYLCGNYQKSAECLEHVFRALEHPERYDLDEGMQNALQQEKVLILFLLADAYLLQKDAAHAEFYIEKARQAEREEIEKDAELTQAQRKEKLEMLKTSAEFYRAKIAYAKNDLGNAKILLEITLRELRPEGGLEMTPYELYVEVLQALDQEEEILPALKRYYAKNPEDDALGFFLAKKLAQAARETQEKEKSREYERQAELLLKELLQKNPDKESASEFLELAVRTGDVPRLWDAIYAVFPCVDSTEDFCYIFMKTSQNMKEPQESEEPKERGENHTEKEMAGASDEESAEKETGKETAVNSEAGMFVQDEEVLKRKQREELRRKAGAFLEKGGPEISEMMEKELSFYLLLKQAVEHGRKQILPEASSGEWSEKWKMGILLEMAGDSARGTEYLHAAQKSLDAGKTDENAVFFFVDQGLLQYAKNNSSESVTCFGNAVKHAKKQELRASLYMYYTSALMMDDQFLRALEVVDDGLKENERAFQLKFQRASILCRLNRHEDAKKEYREFIDAYKDEYRSVMIREMLRDARLGLSSVESFTGCEEIAEELLEQVLDEFPDDVGAKNDLAYLWSQRKKNLHRALKMSEAAVSSDPENASYLDTLACVFFQMKDYQKSLESLQNALKLEEDPVILLHLGSLYAVLGRMSDAEESWKKAEEVFLKYREEGKLVSPEDERYVRQCLQACSQEGVSSEMEIFHEGFNLRTP